MTTTTLVSHYRKLAAILIIGLSISGCGGQPPPQLDFAFPPSGATLVYSGRPLNVSVSGSNLPPDYQRGGNWWATVTDNGEDLWNETAFVRAGIESSTGPGGLTQFELPYPDDIGRYTGSGTFLTVDFLPSTYGTHNLTATVCAGQGAGHCLSPISENICIVPDPTNPPAHVFYGHFSVPVNSLPVSHLGSCIFPPTIQPTPNPANNVQAYPNPIYYGNTCPALATVTFRAALTLPPGITADLVTVQAHVTVVIGASETHSGSLLVPMLPNGTWDTVSGGPVFQGTVALTHPYNDANDQFDPASLAGGSGALLWYVDISSHDASGERSTYLGRSPNQVLDLSPCPVAGNPTHHPGGGTGSASGCGQYSNEASCNLGGCSWNSGPSTCTVNP